MYGYFLLCNLLLTLVHSGLGSWGDVDPRYQGCVQSCNKTECNDLTDYYYPNAALRKHSPYSIPLYQIVPLTCEEICNYGCIEEISTFRTKANLSPTKYYGHWPFTRYFGLEEPASVVFSVLNAVPHFIYFMKQAEVYRNRGAVRCYITPWLMAYSVTACICWLSSATYHSKKTFATTQLDLVSALGFIAFGLFIAVRRIVGRNARAAGVATVSTAMLACWISRASAMIQGQVSFNSHMMLSIGLVVITTSLWLAWILYAQFFELKREELSIKYLCLLCQVWLICASALEIFDFPPYVGIFDAHAVWHLATVPLGFLWYKFWELDKPYRL